MDGNYQTPYTTIAYTDPIPLLLPNHAYHNVMRYNTYNQPENGSFGYETHNFRLDHNHMT
jgi:hypothetical protein